MLNTNIIIKGIGGFYYVKTENGIIECRAKGIFRNKKISPVAGDYVNVKLEDNTYVITEILNRKNLFVRPPISNVDNFFLVISTVQPVPNTLVIDKLLAIAVNKNVKPYLVVTKNDIKENDFLIDIYEKSNIDIICVNALTGEGISKIKDNLNGKISVFCGNSGVGKSTLLSALLPNVKIETGEISKKLKRGRHTTRQVTLYDVAGGLLADTPGFSSIDMEKACDISKEQLQYSFIEFLPFIGKCKFTDCSHIAESGCEIKQAVQEGIISNLRYENYIVLYNDAVEHSKNKY